MTVDVSRFREHRTRDELNSLLHYGHIIPVSRGWTSEYVATHYPGWTWNELMAIFQAAGIVVGRGGSPPKCDDSVEVFHFSSPTEFHVEWVDGFEPARVRRRRLAAAAVASGAQGPGTVDDASQPLHQGEHLPPVWEDFRRRLAGVLASLGEDQSMMIEVADGPNYFVEFTTYGMDGLRAELVSNHFLEEGFQHTPEACAIAEQLGWVPPNMTPEQYRAEGGFDDSPNYRIDWEPPVPFDTVAELVVCTLTEVLEVRSPDELSYDAFVVEGESLEFPSLGLRRVQPQPQPGIVLRELSLWDVLQPDGDAGESEGDASRPLPSPTGPRAWTEVFRKSRGCPAVFNLTRDGEEAVAAVLKEIGLPSFSYGLNSPSLVMSTPLLDGWVNTLDPDGLRPGSLGRASRVIGYRPFRLLCHLLNLTPPRRLKNEPPIPPVEELLAELEQQQALPRDELIAMTLPGFVDDLTSLRVLVFGTWGETVGPMDETTRRLLEEERETSTEEHPRVDSNKPTLALFDPGSDPEEIFRHILRMAGVDEEEIERRIERSRKKKE